MTLKLGQKVITKVPAKNYYGNSIPGGKYYYGPKEIVSGKVGIVGAVDVACVRLRKDCKCQTFMCIDFTDGGRAGYHKHEIEPVHKDVI